jgi:putative transcriptional regulator
MSDEHMIRVSRGPEGRLEQIMPDGSTRPCDGQSDWTALDAMTDEEVYQSALADPDNPPRSTAQLARMRRVPNPRWLRLSLGLIQEQFAHQLQIALGTLRDWEQGVRRPDSTAKAYLRVIAANPGAVRLALHAEAYEGVSDANRIEGRREAE